MPLRTYASRTLSPANGVVLLIGGATFGTWFFVSLYLQQVLVDSPIQPGLAFLAMTIAIAAVAGVEQREAGLASGLVNTSRLFGGALGLGILAALATVCRGCRPGLLPAGAKP